MHENKKCTAASSQGSSLHQPGRSELHRSLCDHLNSTYQISDAARCHKNNTISCRPYALTKYFPCSPKQCTPRSRPSSGRINAALCHLPKLYASTKFVASIALLSRQIRSASSPNEKRRHRTILQSPEQAPKHDASAIVEFTSPKRQVR